jgi:dimethylglycine dehydrogenase
MYLPMSRQLALFDLLRREGANLGIGLVGTRALMQTRLEKSFPAWALELSLDYTAVEADMERFVNLDKGDFIGRDAVLNYAAPREKYTSFVVDAGDCAIWGDEAIFLDNEAVGYVTSGGFGPTCAKHIALGYVNCDAYRPGGQYSVEILGQKRPAKLQTEALYDPSGAKMRA